MMLALHYMLDPMLCMCRLGSNQENFGPGSEGDCICDQGHIDSWREKANIAQFVSDIPCPHVVFAGRCLPK